MWGSSGKVKVGAGRLQKETGRPGYMQSADRAGKAELSGPGVATWRASPMVPFMEGVCE